MLKMGNLDELSFPAFFTIALKTSHSRALGLLQEFKYSTER